MQKNERLELLKNILLSEEKEVSKNLASDIKRLQEILDSEEEIADRVNPIINSNIESFSKETLPPMVVKSLRKEIQNSQDAVVEALYPIIGKMIKKYIASEINLLNEKINKQLQNAFSFKNFFKSLFGKKKLADDLMVTATKPELIEIFVIEKDSGLLIAKHSKYELESMDEDLIAGMLTAIKSFVEDAFKKENQNLETITYDLYTLHIQNFYHYYITAVVSGPYNSVTKDLLENKILDFAQNGISKDDLNNNEIFTNRLKEYFNNEII